MSRCVLFLSIFIAVVTPVYGGIVHVPADQPTIQDAIDAASNGDTVLVSPGTYKEAIDFHGKAITVASVSGPSVTFIDGQNFGTVVNFSTSEGPTSQLKGFTIQHGSATFGAGINMLLASPTIVGNVFQSNNEWSGGYGAAIGGDVASPDIERNTFFNNTCDTQFDSGVVTFINGSSPRIANNIFHDNPCRAINMSLPQGPQPHVINNTIIRNSVGIRVDARVITSGQIYENNLLESNQVGLEVDFLNPGYEPTWKNNDVFNSTTNYEGINDLTGTASNLAVDPKIISSSNFHLQFGSPIIDHGDSSAPGLPSTDFGGFPRVQGATVDIGAFEFFSTTVSLTPTNLSFSKQLLGTTSSSQPVTAKNTGTKPLFVAISTTGDFLQKSNCPATLATGASCTVNVSFKPSTVGTRTGRLLFSDNANLSPQNVALTGTGQGFPIASLSTTSLTFAVQSLGSTSGTKNVTLKNTGTVALSVSSIGISGDFFVSVNTCGSTLAPLASCLIGVAFKPTAIGTRTGVLSISDNASGSPQHVSLSGTITVVALSPASLKFSPQLLNTTSAAQTVTLANHSYASLTISSITISGTNAAAFVIASKTCSSVLAGNSSCTVSVTFRPSIIGAETATLSFSDSGGASPQGVTLSGTGTVVTLSTATLAFAPQTVGTTSALQSVTLTNHATTSLQISSIAITGTNPTDYVILPPTCPPGLPGNSFCLVLIEFRPTATGSRAAVLSVSDNGGASPQQVKLTGTGQ